MKGLRNHILVCILLLSLGCTFLTSRIAPTDESTLGAPTSAPPTATQPAVARPTTTPAATQPGVVEPTTPPAMPIAGELIQPSDLEYLGAFRLPEGAPPEIGWGYSGAAMAYYPGGDPDGGDDGFPGSIFATGHNWNQYISEISIPVPLPGVDLNALNVATTLQEFQNIRGNLFDHLDFEVPRAALAILPPQGEQASDKLYFCWHQHMGEGDTFPTHGWSELNLANPQTAGPWRIGEFWNYATCDYLFEIPQAWAQAYTPGMRLATGRFRDGGQGGMGPSLFAIGPWNHGNPPERGSTIDAIPLLLYSDVYSEENHTLNDYHHSDEWAGGAWLNVGDKSAVIFAGTKGQGDCWYGCQDGTVWPDEPPFPPECPERGWWSTTFVGQILFYNPADLAAVARGELESWAPQPYATLNIDSYLYNILSEQQWAHVGDVDFDREHGLLYILEPLADEDKSLVHVWRVNP